VTCRVSWGVPDVLDVRISRDRLAEIATRHGGKVTPDAAEASVFRVEVPVARWEAFSREVGIAERNLAHPAEVDCVRVGVRLVP
jgi:hypothetical protein